MTKEGIEYKDKLYKDVWERLDSIASGGEPPKRSLNILVIEDNELDFFMLERGLTDLGIDSNITCVDNGVDALLYLTRSTEYVDHPVPDLIFLDINLPKMSGNKILEYIDSKHYLKNIPVITISSEKTVTNGTQSLSKPLDKTRLGAILGSLSVINLFT